MVCARDGGSTLLKERHQLLTQTHSHISRGKCRAPPLQDTFYMLLNQYKGQDFVLSCREADEQAAADMFVQVA